MASFRFATKIKIIGDLPTLTISKIEQITISRGKNKPLEWEVTIPDTMDRDFCPNNLDSDNYSHLQRDVYNSAGELKRWWQIQIKIGDDTWISPKLVLLSSSRFCGDNGYYTVFRGTDLTKNLLIENETAESKISNNSTTIYYAKNLIQNILNDYKIGESDLEEFEDFAVPQIHFQGQSPSDIINRICNVNRTFWFMDVEGLTFKPNISKSSGFDWIIKDRINITDITFDDASEEIVNEIQVIRTSGASATEEFEGEAATDRQEISLATPRYSPQLRLLASKWTVIEDIEWQDANGVFKSEGSTGPFVKLFFTPRYEIPLGSVNNGGLAYWKVQVSGIPATQNLSGAYSENYAITVRDQASIQKYGRMPSASPIEDPIIPTRGWAEKHGRLILKEKSRQQNKLSFTLPRLNPWIKPGDVLLLTEYGTAIEEQKVIVEEISHSLIDAETTIGAIKYEEE